MPPPASSRLALLLLPRGAGVGPAALEALAARWAGRVVVPGGHRPPRVVDGGHERFLANRQGGFRVRCPVDGANLVPVFPRALERWRAGGPRTLACPCGATHDLAELTYAPDAGFARAWLELAEVGSGELTPEALAEAEAALGGVRIVPRRG